jgi:hypothetical protein
MVEQLLYVKIFFMIFFQNINLKIIKVLILLLTIYFIPCFLAAGAEDEGTLGTSFLSQFFFISFQVIRFPTHTIFWDLFSKTLGVYVLGLFINMLIYSFLIERVLFFIKRFSNHDSGD